METPEILLHFGLLLLGGGLVGAGYYGWKRGRLLLGLFLALVGLGLLVNFVANGPDLVIRA